MQLDIAFRHMKQSPAVAARVEARAARLAERFDPRSSIRALLDLDGKEGVVEVEAHIGRNHLVSRGAATDLYRAVDVAFDRLATRAGRLHDRAVRRRKRRAGTRPATP